MMSPMRRSAAIGAVLAALVALSVAPSSGGSADGAAPQGGRSLKGRFLVATPRMEDPRFAKSVVYMVDHTPRGAMGFIVNRAFGTGPLAEFLKGFGIEAKVPAKPEVFVLLFDFNSAALRPEGTETLDSVVEATKKGRPLRVDVSGYTDRAGLAIYNMILSKRRARTVRNALIERGVPRELVTISGYGETRTKVPTPDGMRDPRNRRVEVAVVPAEDDGVADATIRIHYGGPVKPGRGFVLHTGDWAGKDTIRVSERVSMTVEMGVLRDLAAGKGPSRLLFVMGYAGWGPQQLEGEMAREDWLTAPEDVGIIFGDDQEAKWERARAGAGLEL